MTPKQFHYPLFFNLQEVNGLLKPLGWQCFIREVASEQEPEKAVISKRDERHEVDSDPNEVILTSYTFLMIQSSRLFTWSKYEDGLLIRQFDLLASQIHTSLLEAFIPVGPLVVGQQKHSTVLTFDHFVTYIRIPNLPQPESHFEQYVVIHLHGGYITVIPMDEFNASGGDPMYVWPVLASYEPQSGILYGLGMRMGEFSMRLG